MIYNNNNNEFHNDDFARELSSMAENSSMRPVVNGQAHFFNIMVMMLLEIIS